MSTHSKPIDNIIKELASIQEKKSSLAIKDSELFLSEGALWFSAKEKFFQKKSESWASFLRKLKVPLDTVEDKVAIYKKWVNELGYSAKDLVGIHTKKLRRAIPHADTRKKAAKILVKARELSLSEFLLWLKKHFKK